MKTLLNEMPHIGPAKCPYCNYKFYFDAQIERWPLEKPVKEKLFAEYLKHHQIALPCPKCHKDMVIDANTKKTFKYDQIIDKVKPALAKFFKTAKLIIPPFVTMNQILPEQEETHLSFKTFSEAVDMADHEPKIISFDFDGTIARKKEVPVNDYINKEILIPNDYVIDKIKKHIADGDKVILVTTRFDKFMQEVKNFLIKHDIPISLKDIHNTNMNWKKDTLKKLNVDIHYDDNPDELEQLKKVGIEGVLVTI